MLDQEIINQFSAAILGELFQQPGLAGWLLVVV